MSNVKTIEVIDIPSVLEILPIVLEIQEQTILLVIVYRTPDPLGTFIDDLTWCPPPQEDGGGVIF